MHVQGAGRHLCRTELCLALGAGGSYPRIGSIPVRNLPSPMHIKRDPLASKILLWFGGAVLALLSGCNAVTLTNLTSSALPENPSQIYTFTLRVVKKFPRTMPDQIDRCAHRRGRGSDVPDEKELCSARRGFRVRIPGAAQARGHRLLLPRATTACPRPRPTPMSCTPRSSGATCCSLEANRGPVGASAWASSGADSPPRI